MNKKQKDLTKVFIFLFILSFILFNWNDVSWLFNYKEVGGLAEAFFSPYNDSTLLVSADTQENEIPPPQPAQIAYPYTDKENSLEIPKIQLTTSLVVGQSTDPGIVAQELDKGVVYYPGSVAPGQNGQMVVLGHSAPPNWPHIKHDWVFSELNSLNVGDEIILYFNHYQYTYKIKDKNIIQKGQDISGEGVNAQNNILTLVSCWPPGKNYQRIAVEAELVKGQLSLN